MADFFNNPDVSSALNFASDATFGAQVASKAASIANLALPGIFSTLTGPLGFGIKAAADVYSANPSKKGWLSRLLERQIAPLRKLGILATSQAEDAFGGYGTAEAEEEGVAGIDTSATGAVGGGEFSMDDDDPNAETTHESPAPPDPMSGGYTGSMGGHGYGEGYDISSEGLGYGFDGGGDDGSDDDGGWGDFADGGLAESKFPEDPRRSIGPLSDKGMTVSEYLLFTAEPYRLHLTGRAGTDTTSGALTLKSLNDSLPNFSAFASAKSPRYALEETGDRNRPYRIVPGETPDSYELGYNVSKGPVSFNRVFSKKPEESLTTIDNIKAGANILGVPVSGFYQEESQPEAHEREASLYGGSLRMGPVEFFGQRKTTDQQPVPEKFRHHFKDPSLRTTETKVGARGRIPIGRKGIMSGQVAQRRIKDLIPQHLSMRERPQNRRSVTDAQLGYRHQFSDGSWGIGGNLSKQPNVRGSGGLQMFYNKLNPFGLGGNFRATGSLVRPDREKTAAEIMARYGIRF